MSVLDLRDPGVSSACTVMCPYSCDMSDPELPVLGYSKSMVPAKHVVSLLDFTPSVVQRADSCLICEISLFRLQKLEMLLMVTRTVHVIIVPSNLQGVASLMLYDDCRHLLLLALVEAQCVQMCEVAQYMPVHQGTESGC